MASKRKYAFSNIEQYREYLEIKNLRGKNIIAFWVFFALMILTIVYLFLADYPISKIIPIGFSYLLLIIVNFVLNAYGDTETKFLKINNYVSTLGMFSIATAMVIIFQSPSVIPLLFIAYCICVIYQDIKVMIISDLYFLFAIIFIVINYPNLLGQASSTGNNFSITLFSILFMLMFSISAYIIIKEKSFFHNQISNSKEIEYRNIDLLLKLKKDTNLDDKNILSYYDRTNEFLQAFSDKLEIPNIFQERIEILKLIENGTNYENIISKYPDYTLSDLKRLENIVISNNTDLTKIAVKILNTNVSDIRKREIFSSTHFKSFNKQSDSIEIKIIAFVVFYVALKKGLLGMPKLEDLDIYNMLTNSDYYYYINSRVIKIYQENKDVFDAIINDALGKGGSQR